MICHKANQHMKPWQIKLIRADYSNLLLKLVCNYDVIYCYPNLHTCVWVLFHNRLQKVHPYFNDAPYQSVWDSSSSTGPPCSPNPDPPVWWGVRCCSFSFPLCVCVLYMQVNICVLAWKRTSVLLLHFWRSSCSKKGDVRNQQHKYIFICQYSTIKHILSLQQ